MSLIEISKPFEAYLVEEEQGATAYERQFLLVLPFETEGGKALEVREYSWSYSAAQAKEDGKIGFDGLTPRRNSAIASLRRQVEVELAERNERLYEVPGNPLLVWGARES